MILEMDKFAGNLSPWNYLIRLMILTSEKVEYRWLYPILNSVYGKIMFIPDEVRVLKIITI